MAGRRLALLVAGDTFDDAGLAALRAPQADVAALGAVLADAEIGGFEVEQLINGTSSELRLAVSRLFARRDPDDFVLLHVSSHGLKDASGELYLATRDTHREQLDATSVEATYLRKQMDRSRAGAAVLLLDCCYGGAFERGMLPRSDSSLDLSEAFVSDHPGRGRAVITASTALEYAFEGTELRADQSADPSVFTEAVVSGLHEGAADTDGDGVVSLSEFFAYVSHRVRQRSTHQTPQWWLYGMSGDLVIARNPSPVVTPRDLPADVMDVLTFPQAAARLGAVAALRELLRQDPGVALTAYRTLETLALDDSRQVSTAAAGALGQVHVTVEPLVLDFGRVAVGESAPELTLELSGSLAGACTLDVRRSPVTMVRRGGRVRVTLDTSTAADAAGEIELVGPGGGVVVEVRGQVAPGRPRATGGRDPVGRLALRTVRRPATSKMGSTVRIEALRSPETLGDHGTETPPSIRTLLRVGWLLALAFAVSGLLPLNRDYSSSWHFENTLYGKLHTVLAIGSVPLVLVGLRLNRSPRARLACAAALGGVGLKAAFMVLLVLAADGEDAASGWPTYLAVLVVSLAVVTVSALLVRRLIPRPAVSGRRPTTVSVVLTLTLVVGCAALVVQGVHVSDHAATPYAVFYGVVSLVLLLNPSAPGRVVQAGAAAGWALCTVLALSALVGSSENPQDQVDFLLSLVTTAVTFSYIAPSWRALSAPSTELSGPA